MRLTLSAPVLSPTLTLLMPALTLAATPSIHNLGTLGGNNSLGRAVNDAAQVAGYSDIIGDATLHAFRYDGTPGAGGVMHDLGTLGGTDSFGEGINNAGQVAGWSHTTDNFTFHAFRYDGTPGSGGVMRDLGTLGGTASSAWGINNAGQVAGDSQTTGNTAEHAFRYDGTPGSGGVMRDLGTLGGTYSYGRAVNDVGQVTGESASHAFRYDGTPGSGGVMRDLSTLGGTFSTGNAVNNAGQVAGYSYITGDIIGEAIWHAFRYDGTPGGGGIMRDLGTLGGTLSVASDLNDAGQVVGGSQITGDMAAHGFLYIGTPGVDGQMIDLDDWLNANNPTEGAKWIVGHAFGISETGWITGAGDYDPDGPGGIAAGTRVYLLDASSLVPEPSGLALLALAASALLRRRHQSRQRQAIGRACCEVLEGRRLLSFSPAVNYATIGTPSAIVTADLNNDGKLDLVTCANAVTGSFSVFLGDGAGGFGAAQRTVMGTQNTSLAAADFNNDGKLDLVVSDNYDQGFDFLAGKGDGTFQPPVYTASGAVAAVGRFNGDSYTDVLVTRLGPDWETQFQVYSGNGQGGFTAVEPDLWYYGSGMTAVDLNNDGKLDVVTAEGYVFPGNGDGTFQFDWEQPALLDGGEIATGDFTGDGKVDAIVAGNNKVSVLRGHGDGTFDVPITQALTGQHTGVATADFNGDGKLDAIVSSNDTAAVRLMLGNGDGTLRDGGTFATGSGPSGVVVGDFNRDGRPDVAVSNTVSRTVSVLLNDGVWPGSKTFIGPGGAGSGGNWSTAANWSPGGVPATGDVVTITGKSVNLAASTTVGGLNLLGGATLTLGANGGRVLRTSSLSISANSKLNLADNDLLLDYTGTSRYAAVKAYVVAGRNTGTGGIVTTATADTALAVADNALLARTSWAGQSIDATTIIGKYTFLGDADLDGAVTSDDYVAVDVNLGVAPGTRQWIHGDFNFDGSVTSDDYVAIDVNLGKGALVPLAYDQEQAEMIALHAEQFGRKTYIKAIEAAAVTRYKIRGIKRTSMQG